MEKNERNIIKHTVEEKTTDAEKENVIKGWTLIGYSVEDIALALGTDVTYVEKCLERYFKRVHYSGRFKWGSGEIIR